MCNGITNIKMSRKDAMPALGNLKLEMGGQMSKQNRLHSAMRELDTKYSGS